jgi:putative phosphoribosyl transferase
MRDEVRRRPVPIGARWLAGELAAPPDPRGVVIFAHGSGGSRPSPRSADVAGALHCRGFATLHFALLTEAEAADRQNVFDIPLLSARVGEALAWSRDAAAGLPLALFGANSGAAAALVASTSRAARSILSSRRSCSSLAAPTTRSSSSSAPPSRASPGRSNSRSCRPPRTTSRSLAHSPRSPTWPATG